jgi:hypothetical protein
MRTIDLRGHAKGDPPYVKSQRKNDTIDGQGRRDPRRRGHRPGCRQRPGAIAVHARQPAPCRPGQCRPLPAAGPGREGRGYGRRRDRQRSPGRPAIACAFPAPLSPPGRTLHPPERTLGHHGIAQLVLLRAECCPVDRDVCKLDLRDWSAPFLADIQEPTRGRQKGGCFAISATRLRIEIG